MSVTQLIARKRKRHFAALTAGWIGVDIGSHGLKIAQLERDGSHVRIARSVVSRPAGGRLFNRQAIEEGRLDEPLGQALKTHGGFLGNRAACVISMNECELRTVPPVAGTHRDQRESIAAELLKDTQRSSDYREFDFWGAQASNSTPAARNAQLHVVSLPQSLADAVGHALLTAGLRCQVLDTLPFCMQRAAELAAASNSDVIALPRAHAVLDWGCSSATLTVIQDDQLVMSRCLRGCGLQHFKEQLHRRLQLNPTQMDTLLMNIGVHGIERSPAAASELNVLLEELLAPVLMQLAEELRDTFDFLRFQLHDGGLGQLLVTGLGAAIPGVADQLQANLTVPVKTWSMGKPTATCNHPQSILANAAALSALAWEK